MAVIRPFKAIRPTRENAHLVASVPYDVVNREEAAELAKDNPINFIRVTRSEIDLDRNINPYDPKVYEKAKENFEKLKVEAPLVQDETPHFYIYKLTMGDQEQAGIAATFSVLDYDNDVIKKHEKTRKVKEDDRTNHIITTQAQTGAVFLTYKAVKEIDAIVDKAMREDEPLYDFDAGDGVRHQVWTIPTDYNDIIEFEIGKVEHLYIADGHHRAASASRAHKVKKESSVDQSGTEEYNYFMAVLFPAGQLDIMPYNRVVFDLESDEKSFLEKVKKHFEIIESGNPKPNGRREISMYLGGKWFTLTPNDTVVPGEKYGDNLDVSILQNYLFKPVFGIDDPRTSEKLDFIGGIRGTEELEKLVDSGKAAVAFSMYPVSVDDLIAISDANEVMPPKSTWFEPKLRDGLLIHEI